MRLPSTRRTLSAALVPFLLVGVTACGGDDKDSKATDGSSAFQPFGGGGSDSPSTGSTEGTAPTEASTPAAPESSAATEGAEISVDDFKAIMEQSIQSQGSSDLKMTMDAAGSKVTATGSMDPSDPKNPKVKMTMEMSGSSLGGAATKIDMILIDNTVYMKMDALTATIGDKWIKMPMSALGSAAGMGDLTDQMDPTKSLQNLVPGLKTVTYQGETTRGDGSAKEYRVVVDSTKVESLKSTPGVPAEVTYDLFFDDKSRIVGMDMDIAGSKVEMTMDNFDSGVKVTAPPANEVSDQDFSSMMGGATS